MKTSVVYFLVDPLKNQPFYIGIGQKSRLRDHFRDADSKKKSYKLFKIRSLRSLGVRDAEMIRVIADGLSRVEAACAEIVLIAEWGRHGIDVNGILTNRAMGGDLGNPEHARAMRLREWSDPDTRSKRIEVMRAAHQRPDVIQKHRENGFCAWEKNREKMYSARMRPESASLRREAAIKASVAARLVLADPLKAASLSAKRHAIWADPVYRERMSQERKARWQRPGYRERMAIAIRRGKAAAAP